MAERGKAKSSHAFKLKSGEPFAFAGLWDSWKQPDGNLLRTYTIVTTEPNDVLRPIHNRMPVMLSNDDAQKWLAVDDEIAHALTLLKPYPPDEMEGYKVSILVNNPRNDTPECVRPLQLHRRIIRLIPFSEALSSCQRASGFVVSIPGSVSAVRIVQLPLFIRRVCAKNESAATTSRRSAHLFTGLITASLSIAMARSILRRLSLRRAWRLSRFIEFSPTVNLSLGPLCSDRRHQTGLNRSLKSQKTLTRPRRPANLIGINQRKHLSSYPRWFDFQLVANSHDSEDPVIALAV